MLDLPYFSGIRCVIFCIGLRFLRVTIYFWLQWRITGVLVMGWSSPSVGRTTGMRGANWFLIAWDLNLLLLYDDFLVLSFQGLNFLPQLLDLELVLLVRFVYLFCQFLYWPTRFTLIIILCLIILGRFLLNLCKHDFDIFRGNSTISTMLLAHLLANKCGIIASVVTWVVSRIRLRLLGVTLIICFPLLFAFTSLAALRLATLLADLCLLLLLLIIVPPYYSIFSFVFQWNTQVDLLLARVDLMVLLH